MSNINIFEICYKRMLSYCLKCQKDTGSINWKVSKTSNGRIMLWSQCAVCNSEN